MRNKIRETPWGEMTYYDYKKRIEFEEDEYTEIDNYCKSTLKNTILVLIDISIF